MTISAAQCLDSTGGLGRGARTVPGPAGSDPRRCHAADRPVPIHRQPATRRAARRRRSSSRAGGLRRPVAARPAGSRFNRDRGVLLVADIGATGMRAALCDLRGEVSAETRARHRRHRRTAGRALRRRRDVRPSCSPRPAGAPAEVHGHRHRRARPGRLRLRSGGQPADHERLGPVRHPRLVRRPLRLSGAGRQGRQRDGVRRAAQHVPGRSPAAHAQGRHRHRRRDDPRRRGLPGRRRRGRRHRAHPGDRAGRRDRAGLPLRQHRLRRGVRRRLGPGPRPARGRARRLHRRRRGRP